MLELKNIKKDYTMGGETIQALKGIDLKLRDSEFVSILGPSGCGKTTLLNIIGGLDRYSDGDLFINGKSTKDYKDRDWDYYRNYSVGFVFQSYNLIPHQTVLSNVEMSLTISGYSKEEKKKKAIKALEDVGLKDQIHKKPNQLSGGQMQRVAIARAIVNDPDIILADEPTGALDTKTSVQIMELLKTISKDKLIVMVTHNPDLAEKYSTRIVKLVDGKITSDSNPCTDEKVEIKENRKKSKSKKTQMSFFTALHLSLNNLMTKKGRTFLTSFAGSVGIIGIALILSLSTGMRNYIKKVEEDTLSSYPISIEKESVDMSTLMVAMMDQREDNIEYNDDKIHKKNIMTDIISTMSQEVQTNNLEEFKNHLENEDSIIKENSNAIQYSYNFDLNLYKLNDDDTYTQTNPSQVMTSFGELGNMFTMDAATTSSSMTSTNIWSELLDNLDLLKTQYDVIAGHFPENKQEVVLILDKNNQISDYTLYSLGLKDLSEVKDMYKRIMNGEKVEKGNDEAYTYEDFLNLKFKLLLNHEYFVKENGIWKDKSKNQDFIKSKLDNALDIKIAGIIKPKEESNITTETYGEIGYLNELTKYAIDKINESEIVKEQKENKEINVFTGTEFVKNENNSIGNIQNPLATLTNEQKIQLSKMTEEEKLEFLSSYSEISSATYEDNEKKLGMVDLNNPSAINIYPIAFENKEIIKDEISKYNEKQKEMGKEENTIEYTDFVGTMMTSVTRIVDIISYVLMAFVSISLVVSSIMIAIITYISVLERTKEIGILRAMGTSKKDISKIFNAETFIEGAISGIMGIAITLLLDIPINLILGKIIGVSTIASLPILGGAVLILISIILNVIAGLIPAKFAAKKDPAVVLRTE